MRNRGGWDVGETWRTLSGTFKEGWQVWKLGNHPWECLESCSRNSLAWKGHALWPSTTLPLRGSGWEFWAQRHPVWGEMGPSLAQKEGCALACSTAVSGEQRRWLSSGSSPYHHLPAPGLSCGPGEGSKEEARRQVFGVQGSQGNSAVAIPASEVLV